MAGTYLGGVLACRHGAHNERLQLKALAVVYASFGLLSAFIYLSSNKYLAFGLLELPASGGPTTMGPYFPWFQRLVPHPRPPRPLPRFSRLPNSTGWGLGPLRLGP